MEVALLIADNLEMTDSIEGEFGNTSIIIPCNLENFSQSKHPLYLAFNICYVLSEAGGLSSMRT
jgi:hypothetical protein